MPADYSVHGIGVMVMGNHPPAPPLPAQGGQLALAEGVDSADIVIGANGGVLCICATTKLRLDVQSTAAGSAALNPAGSPVVLVADQPRIFSLGRGTYKLRTAAY